MRVVITVHVYDEENMQLTVETWEVTASIAILNHCVRWADLGLEIATRALDKAWATVEMEEAQAEAAAQVCPDA